MCGISSTLTIRYWPGGSETKHRDRGCEFNTHDAHITSYDKVERADGNHSRLNNPLTRRFADKLHPVLAGRGRPDSR